MTRRMEPCPDMMGRVLELMKAAPNGLTIGQIGRLLDIGGHEALFYAKAALRAGSARDMGKRRCSTNHKISVVYGFLRPYQGPQGKTLRRYTPPRGRTFSPIYPRHASERPADAAFSQWAMHRLAALTLPDELRQNLCCVIGGTAPGALVMAGGAA